jgi:hypothetical protein
MILTPYAGASLHFLIYLLVVFFVRRIPTYINIGFRVRTVRGVVHQIMAPAERSAVCQIMGPFDGIAWQNKNNWTVLAGVLDDGVEITTGALNLLKEWSGA